MLLEEKIVFKTARGMKLSGMLLYLGSNIQDVVIFSHGTGSNKNSIRNRQIADKLLDNGMASFLFDFTGHGESDGLMEQSTQEQQADDLISAIDFIEEQNIFKPGCIGVNGSSTGGTVALQVAAEDARIQVLAVRVPRNYNINKSLSTINCPTLILQGSEDHIVLPEAIEIFHALKCPRTFHLVQGAGHLFDEQPEYMQEMIDVTTEWFTRWFAELCED